MTVLYEEWKRAKRDEQNAIARRRKIEDQLIEQEGIPDTLDGTVNVEKGGFKLKVTGRVNRRVDGDKLQDIAAEYGLSEHLSSLFRWKPEINMAAWKATSPEITNPLAQAITAKPGRPSFTITQEID